MKVIAILCLFCCHLQAGVNSTTGNIFFDRNADGTHEMQLSFVGLGIGIDPSANLHVNGNALISQQLTIGQSTLSSTSNLYVAGTMGFSSQSLTTDSNVIQSYVFSDTSSSDQLAILPQASLMSGRMVTIKQTSSSNVTQITAKNSYISGVTGILKLANTSGNALPVAKLISASGNWHILNSISASETLTGNLVGAWHLDDTTGSTYLDHTSGGNHIALTGLTPSGNTTTGQVLQGVKFGGTRAGHGKFPTALSDLYLYNYTLSCWYRPDVVPPGAVASDATFAQSLISKPGDHIGLHYRNTQKFRLGYFTAGGAFKVADSTLTYAIGQFYHVVGVVSRSSGTVQLYVNGVLQGDSSFTAGDAPLTNTWQWRLGVSVAGADAYSYPANGAIDEVKMFNRALSASEVQQLYNEFR
jgi:hypothetical protein